MTTGSTAEVLLGQLSPSLLEAAKRRAAQAASRLAIAIARVSSELGTAPPQLTSAQLLGLAAILRLKDWEAIEGFDRSGHGLPSYADALERFANGSLISDTAAYHVWLSELSKRVLTVDLEFFAWTIPDDWDGDVLLKVNDIEQMLDAVAEVILSRLQRTDSTDPGEQE